MDRMVPWSPLAGKESRNEIITNGRKKSLKFCPTA
jgi:hypothetical protein